MTKTPVETALDDLTEAQAAAVNWGEGPMFVLAGPGSGKTRVLTTRVARLLADSPDRSFRVLALTFTNKAADEMAARVSQLVPEQERRALVGTFHSFCMQMLQQHGSHIGINPDFQIYSLESEREELLKEAIRKNGFDPGDTRFLSIIDKLKARLIQPEGSAQRFREGGDHVEAVYRAYEDALKAANALDFSSLIAQAHRLVTTYPAVAARYRRSYAYWMFDEFQDTTDGQYRLIKDLAGGEFKNILAVADDDQIIYQWNGASFKQIQRFRADYQPAEIQLPTNYRCPPEIVYAANRLVVHNQQRTTTKQPLEAGKTNLRYPGASQINLMRFSSESAEAAGIANSIAQAGQARWGEIAVLARTKALLDRIHTALGAAGIPSVIAQRRDDFRSPQFLWLASVLRQALRPMDRRALEALTGAFNRWFGTEVTVEEVVAQSDVTSRSFLDEWADAVSAVGLVEASQIAALAAKFGREPSQFRAFMATSVERFPTTEDITSDTAEDLAAWKDLTRAIGQSVGRDAPLEQFLQELALRSKEPPITGQTVTLMTIHGAKGKEFDHVYLAGLAEDVLPSFQAIREGEASAEMEEERRNCFVAITRAREWLCLSYADTYRNWQKAPSRFLTEMGFQLPAAPAS